MSWFSRCSWCGGPFNGGNCRHCTNVSFGDEPVYDSNPNSTPDFSNPLPHHNYETDSRSDTGAAFQAEFAKFQQNFERFMAQLRCSHCGGLFIVLEEGTGRGDGQGKGKGSFYFIRDASTPKLSIASILEGFTNEPPLEENDDLFDLESKENEWKKILYDAPIDDLMTEDKVCDPEINEKTFSPTYVRLPFEDRHYLSHTYVIRNFLPYFTYPVESYFLLSSRSEDTIFNPVISAFHFSSLEPVASHRSGTFICFNVYPNILNESPMRVCSSTCFVPNITMIWGESR
ncbi:hypothetical protein Tco_0766122 [Tanacetum coccineum]